MSEKSPQFVGTADASKVRDEALKKADVKLSPEQQKVSDVMTESGEKLVDNVVDAREAAGQKLQGLHGKELVEAGKKQMIRGIVDTVKTQAKWAIPLAIIMGGIGVGRGRHKGRDVALFFGGVGAAAGAGLGYGIGYEVAPLRFNKQIKGNLEMSKVGVSDYIISHTASFGINALMTFATMRFPRLWAVASATGIIATDALNPITVRGLRDVIKGSREMKKGM